MNFHLNWDKAFESELLEQLNSEQKFIREKTKITP